MMEFWIEDNITKLQRGITLMEELKKYIKKGSLRLLDLGYEGGQITVKLGFSVEENKTHENQRGYTFLKLSKSA